MRYSAAIAEHFRQADQRDRPEDRADDIAEAAEDHHGQRQDGLLRVEGLVVDVGVEMRGDAAADAGGKAAEDERQRFVAVEAEAIGARGDVVVADGAKAAAEMRAEQASLQQRQHHHQRRS